MEYRLAFEAGWPAIVGRLGAKHQAKFGPYTAIAPTVDEALGRVVLSAAIGRLNALVRIQQERPR